MKPAGYPTGTVTLFFTDIEGSTKLWESAPEAMRVALSAHDGILRAAIDEHGGVVFKTVGDAFCAAFERPQGALLAAIRAQRELAAHPWPEGTGALRVRMGLHTGTAVEEGGDYFGPTVNRVARLMSIGCGEQILVSNATASLLRDVLPADTVLRDLGEHRLKDLGEPERTYQVIAAGLRADFPPLASLDARPNNLPFAISSFVDRKRETSEVRDAFAQRRLVTIVGSGGIGKTRLALQVAAESIAGFKDGTWFVPLSPLRSAELIVQAVADVVNVREEPHAALDVTLAKALAAREMLLVVDNAEHLVGGTAAFVKMLLSRCAGVKVLVTSREPLHLTGELVVRLQALERATDLFVERARAVAPGLAVDRAADRAIADICRRLEGIPLAIELAAARAATIPLPELSARLVKSLNVLVSRDSTTEERHRTLRATIAWSYGLLSPTESAFLRSLGVLRGSFEIGAAAAVAGRSEDESLDVIEALVDKSLVSLLPGGPTARYVVSDTVRDFMVDMLHSDGFLDDVSARHFTYYARQIAANPLRSSGTVAGARLDEIAADIDNLRLALEWGLSHEPIAAAALATGLSSYWKIRGHFSEGRTWMRRLLERDEIAGGARAALLRRAATLVLLQDDYDEARALTSTCRALYEEAGDAGGVGEALHTLGVIEQRCGRLDEAEPLYESALAKFRESGHDQGASLALIGIALLALERNDLDAAEERIAEAAVAVTRLGSADALGHVAILRGDLARRRERFDAAIEHYREALALKTAVGNRYEAADVQDTLAFVYVRQGRLAEARAQACETLLAALELDAAALAVYGFEASSEIAKHERRFDDAARCFCLARELRRRRSFELGIRDMDELERALRAQLGERFHVIAADCAGADWRTAASALVESASPPIGPSPDDRATSSA